MTHDQAREAANQLVRLTRLIMGMDGLPHRRGGPRTPRTTRTLRHNGVLLSPREQQVFELLIKGTCNGLVAQALEISERAVEDHLCALLREFGAPEAPVRAPRTPRRRRATVILAPVTGTVVLCGAPQAVLMFTADRGGESASPQRQPSSPSNPLAAFGVAAGHTRSAGLFKTVTLPNGVATATSFWDPATARGKRMRYRTLASPYWPLGTKVKVTYKDETAVGVVEDFGPADWAVAQHDVPAIIDISEQMMADLTGRRANAVRVRFEVVEWGTGAVYRDSGPGYELATGDD